MSAIPDPASVAPHGLPSGTVTFAFTDIEGSTERWERAAPAMQDAVRRHDALMHATIGGRGGYVFKTVGDAFCAAFSRPADAVCAMLAAQFALAAEDFSAVGGLRVRMAVHTGATDERDGDYFGPVVNRVARLLAIGHGGQVLVSGVAAALVQGALPHDASLRDLGEHRLKDLAARERVYQLVAPGLAAEFGALRSLDARSNNLPAMLTSFVGREGEIAEITALLGTYRLVTLVGAGGIGKTRTSLQVAADMLDGFGDGVWFVELAPLSSGTYIPSAMAQALGLTLSADGDPVTNLVRQLASKQILVVLDNCEHLVDHVARVVAALLRSCPQVKILASSRQPLGIAGEALYRMPSLEVPSEGNAEFTAVEATRLSATALFVERARAVDQRLELTDDNAPVIGEICRRLDGIPLAIELAAARVRILSPRQLRERLDERFRVLTGGSRDALPRQQTLRALIDWSYDLLEERERALFRRLGIFVNGFTLEGAVAVGSGDGLDALVVFDLLASLVDKSLVLAERESDVVRYRLLESTRVYAAEKLSDAGEREACSGRHVRYLRDLLAELRERANRTVREGELNAAIVTELEDIRAALDRALQGSEMRAGGEILAAIGWNWTNLGLDSEGAARIETFIAALSSSESLLLAQLSISLSRILVNCSMFAHGFEVVAQAVAHARAAGDDSTLADALRLSSSCAAKLGRFDAAEAELAEAETITGVENWLRLRLLSARGTLSQIRGDYDAAAPVVEQLRREYAALGSTRGECAAVLNLAEIEHARGRTHQAIALVREVLPELRSQAELMLLVNVLANLAGYLVAVDDLPAARAAAREAIRDLARREPDAVYIATAAEHLALALALSGDVERAASLAGYVDATFQRQGFEREFNEATTHDRLFALLREHVASDELERLLVEGAALPTPAVVDLALQEP